MDARIGNQFWKLRSKHGRGTLFATPELLWEAACEYFEWCENNPLIEQDFAGKDAKEVSKNKMRPFTWQGLAMYCDATSTYFSDFKKECSKDFSEILSRIEDVIYRQKFEGASCGFFNPSIIMRDLGLADKQELTLPDKMKVKFKKRDESQND